MPAPNLKVLIGWKEIAAYLDCSRSTAVRRLEDGLPVFRVGGSIRAFAVDIDRWLEGERLRKMEGERRSDEESGAVVVKDSEIVETVAGYVREGKGLRYAVVPLGVDTLEYERIEDHLKKAEEKSRWVLETIPVWVWETDAQNEFTYSNVASVDMLGYRPEELVGFKPSEFLVHREDVPACEDAFGRIRKKKDAVRNLRCRFVTRENDVRWFEVDAEPAFDARGKFAGVRGVSRDVTARVRAEEKEKEHLAILSFLSRTANDFVAFDPEGDLFAYAAERLQELVGGASVALTSYDEILDSYTVRAVANLGAKTGAILKAFGKDPAGMVFPATGVMKSGLLEGKLRKYDVPLHELTRGLISERLDRKLQEILGFREIYVMGIVRHGKLLGLASIVPPRGTRIGNPEVVEAFINQAAVAIHRKYAEEAYRESEERYRSLFEESPAAVTVFDAEGVIVGVNEAAEDISGYPKEAQLGTELEDIPTFDAAYVPELKAIFARVLAGEEIEPFEIPITRSDGGRRWLNVRPALTKTADDRSGVQVIAVDVTERKRAEAARERERRAFRTIAEAAVEASDTPTLYTRVVKGLVEELGLDFGTVELFDAEKGVLTSACAVGLSKEQLAEKEVPVSLEDEHHLSAYTARSREALFVPDILEHPINKTHGDWLKDLGVRGFISWPLTGAESQLLGVLQLGGRKPKVFEEGDRLFFATVAGMFTTVLERRRAEEALNASDRKFRELFEGSPASVTVVSPAGIIVDANRATEELTGYTREELRGKPFAELPTVVQEDSPGMTERFEALLRGDVGEEYDLEIIRKDKTTRWVRARNSLLWEGETLAGIQVISSDITDRKRAQKALEESEEKFRNVVERANDGVAVIKDGRFVYVNPKIVEVSRYSAEELMSQPFTVFIDPEETPKVSEYYEKRVRGEEVPAVYETVISGKDGNKIYVELNVGPVPYRGETAILAFVRDLTERRRAQELSRIQHELAQGLAAAASLEEAARLCVQAALRASGLDSGGLYAVNVSSGTGELIYHEGLGKKFVEEVSHYDGVSPRAQLVLEGKPRFTSYEELGVPISAAQARERLKAVGVIPITHEGEVVACLNVSSHTAEAIEPWAREALGAIAAQVGGALARIRTEEALRESEEKFRNLVERSNDGIAILVDGRIAYANPRISEATGYATQDVLDEPFGKFVDPEDIAKVSAYYEKRMRGEEVPAVYEIAVRRKDGSKQYVELNVGIVSYHGQTAELVFIRDLTERKRAEEARERERKAFRIIAEAAVHAKGIRALCRRVVAGLAEALGFEIGSIRLYDEETETLEKTASYGITRDEIDDFFPAQTLADRRYFAAHVARTREPIFAPDVTEHDIGRTHRPRIEEMELAAIISWPVLGAEDTLLGVINLASRTPKDVAEEDRIFFETVAGMFATVLERRRAEDGVRKSEAKHRLLLESIGSPVVALDQNMNILYYNEAYATCAGLPERGAEGQNLLEASPPLNATELNKAYAEALSTGITQVAEAECCERYFRTSVYPMPWGILAVAADITERRRAEAALRESEALYRELVETSPDSIAFVDLEGNILAINQPAAAMVGLDLPEEAAGKNILEFIPRDEDKQAAAADIRRTVTEGAIANVSYVLQRADGKVFPTESNASLVRGADGEPKGIILITRDVTERRRAEETLRGSEERYRVLFEGGNDAIFVFNLTADGKPSKFVEINNEACRYLGYSAAELHELTPADLVPPERREAVAGLMSRLVEERELIFEWFHLHKNGTQIPVEISSHLFEFRGEPTVISIVRDITERKRAEEALRESEEKYRATVEQARDGIIMVVDGKLAFVNDYYATMIGYAKDDLIGRPIFDTVPPRLRERFAALYRQALEEGVTPEPVDAVLLTADGREIPAETVSADVTYDGRSAILVIIRNVSERRAAEAELRRAEREKTAILSSMSEHVVYHNTELEILWANEAASSSVGLSPEGLVGRHCYEVWHDRKQPCENCPVAAAIETGGPHEEEVTTPDGRSWFIRGYPIKDEDGNVTNAVEVTLEITDRKRAEDDLRHALAENEALLEAVPDLMFVIDKEGNYVDFKRAEADLFALPPETIIGKNVRDTGLSAEDEREVLAGLERTLRTGETTAVHYGLEVPRGRGTFEARIVKLNDDQVLSVVREITRRNAAEND